MKLLKMKFNKDECEDQLFYNYYKSLEVRRPRKIRKRNQFMANFNEQDFIKRFRIDKRTVQNLYLKIKDKIDPASDRNNAVPGIFRLLMTLRFYATGNFILTIADFGGVSKASAIYFVRLVTTAIADLRRELVVFPNLSTDLIEIKEQFFRIASFPNVVGAMDCTHVKISSPGGENAEYYRNGKGYFSINVQAICDAELKILDVVARWPGSIDDQHIFNSSRIMSRFESGEFGKESIILGDGGYENKSYLVTPLLNANTQAEQLYNDSQTRSQNVIEQAFGVLKQRFPILASGMRCKLDLTYAVVYATSVLHNLAIINKVPLPEAEVDINVDEGNIVDIVENIGEVDTRRCLINSYFSRF